MGEGNAHFVPLRRTPPAPLAHLACSLPDLFLLRLEGTDIKKDTREFKEFREFKALKAFGYLDPLLCFG